MVVQTGDFFFVTLEGGYFCIGGGVSKLNRLVCAGRNEKIVVGDKFYAKDPVFVSY